MNIWDILILVLIAGVVIFALHGAFSRKKKGCSGSCACCSGCLEGLPRECTSGKGGGRD